MFFVRDLPRPPLLRPLVRNARARVAAADPQPRAGEVWDLPFRAFSTPTSRPRLRTQANLSSSPFRPFHTSPRAFPRNYDHYNRPARYSHADAAKARPLLTPKQLRSFGRSRRFRGFLILAVSGFAIFYITHIETVPVSGRRRFNCFSEESAEEQGELIYRAILADQMEKGRVLSRWDPRVLRVERVLGRLIEGAGLGTGKSDKRAGEGWEVHVIDDPSMANAFVLPGGKVFVFSGIFPVCRDNDGLAAVLGHEIAHNIAQHAAEKMSQMVLFQPVVWVLMYLDATGMTFGLGRVLGSLMIELGFMRPSSREQESEADHIGLMLMAEACYDPRGAIGFWERMEKAQTGAPPEWLSTHPSNINRIQRIMEWLPEAEDKFHSSGCASFSGYKNAFQDAIERPFILRI